MTDQPTGTVTMLFSDIEGSTRLLELLGRDRYAEALEVHRRLLREAFGRHHGFEVDCEGDAFFVAFARAEAAAAAAVEAQSALHDTAWPDGLPVRVRIGIHTGEPLAVPPKYVGIDVHKAARIMAAGHGGQVLVSQTTRDLLDSGVLVRPLGEHRLKDLSAPQPLYQLLVAGLPSEFPPLRTLGNHARSLPVQPTPVIGREREIDEVAGLLESDSVRLVTITGAGGTGKTRLALQIAAERVERFADGAYFVNLAPILDSGFVPPAIAQALGLREIEGQPVVELLVDHLRERHVLILLDNFEQVAAAAGFVGVLLSSAASLKLLVTSRAPLHLRGEREYPLAPLPLPTRNGGAGAAAAVSAFPSVGLFLERAQSVKPDFAVTDDNADAIAKICARLDGLPLAIELAAPRVKVLPPHALLERLEQRLSVLTGGARDLPERQRTLRNTIDWSYGLLEPAAQLLFDRLAVFVGGRSLDAIEAVCVTDGAPDAFETVASLGDESLLRQDDAGGEPRFVMLETVHEYARERLEQRGEADDLRGRHRAYFRRLAETAAPHLFGRGQKAWLDRLGREEGNLRVALANAVDSDDEASALALAAALAPFWEVRGRFYEARRAFQGALACGSGSDSQTRARVLFWAGRLALFQGDWSSAEAFLDAAARLAEQTHDQTTLALALGKAGWAAVETGAMERGMSLADEALTLARTLGDDWVTAEVLNDVCCASFRDALDSARAIQEEALQLRRRLGDEINIADSLNNLGYLLLLLDEPAQARSFLEESLTLAGRLEDTRHIALAVGNLALVSLLLGNYADARDRFIECIRLSEQLGDKRGALEAFCGLAAIAAHSGALKDAATLVGAVAGLHAKAGGTPSPGEALVARRFLRPARVQVGSEEWDRIAGEAETMTLEQAIALALSTP